MNNVDSEDINSVLDSIKSNDNNDIEDNKEESISDKLEEDVIFSENKVPDVFNSDSTSIEEVDPIIKERENLKIGISPEDIKSLYQYLSGNGEKPLFIDKFTSDTEGRLKDMIYIINLLQMSSLPMLMSIQSSVRDKLYTTKNLEMMDIKDLSTASLNLSKEVQATINNAANSIQILNQLGSINSEYRKLLDMALLLPDDKFNKLKSFLENNTDSIENNSSNN